MEPKSRKRIKQTSSSNNNIKHVIATMMMMTNVRVSETEREKERRH